MSSGPPRSMASKLARGTAQCARESAVYGQCVLENINNLQAGICKNQFTEYKKCISNFFLCPMAEMHSRTFGTEDDKDNCSFFHKTGACRHGERCSRKHIRPHFSVTVAVPNLYTPPDPSLHLDEQQCFEEFYEDVLREMKKHGRIDDMIIIENLGEHMNGNLYIKYHTEEESERSKRALTGRKYAGQVLEPQYSPVTDFKDSRCRQYDDNTCNRGGYCNFMHIRPLPLWLKKELDECGANNNRDRNTNRDRDHNRDSNRDRGYPHHARDRDASSTNMRDHNTYNRDRDSDFQSRDNYTSRHNGGGGGGGSAYMDRPMPDHNHRDRYNNNDNRDRNYNNTRRDRPFNTHK